MHKEKVRHYNIPIFLPELACPHRCIFCNQENISGSCSIPSPEEIHKTIDQHLATFEDNSKIQIAFFGGSFTGLSIKLQEEYLQAAHSYIKQGKVYGIRISTRPDYIDFERLSLLKKYGVTDIELGAQSFDEDVLRLSGRGHSADAIRSAAKLIKNEGFTLGLQMMIGLPGDTKEKALKTAQEIIKCNADSTRIYPTLIVDNTPLAELFKTGKYNALTIKEAIEWTAEIHELFEKNNIQILRVGLHPNKDFESGEKLLDGPYHASFKELVLTHIWKEKFISKLPQTKGKLSIFVNTVDVPYAIGFESTNRNWLFNKYGWVKIKGKDTIQKNTFEYSINRYTVSQGGES